MNPTRIRKVLLLLAAAALLFGAGRVQLQLNRDRDRLGLTRVQPLENAPPVLAFTTVALGGFRGLISNALWMRASDLQDEDKFFEMAQLADWITKLEPHFVQVWLVQAWNMAYNISVKFKDFPDRWRWVERGIELLRDDGLRYNPNETLIYRELAWFFQHKMGQNLDDANMYYKQEWANEMAGVFGKKTPDLEELIHPQTADQTNRAKLLIEKYKMDPVSMKEVDDHYGPLEWRLPESHAIYWAVKGLKAAEQNPSKINKEDLITLRRVIYQSMQLSFQRGRLISNPFVKAFEFGPNLDIIPKVSAAYEQAANEDEKNRDHIERAHRNMLRDAVYFLYENNRIEDASKWFKYLGKKFPDKTILDKDTNSFPANITLDQYAVGRVIEDVSETSRDRVKAAVEGMLNNSYACLATDQEERALGYKLLARQVLKAYMSKLPKEAEPRVFLPPLEDIDREILSRILDTENGAPFTMRAILRSRLGMPAESIAPAPATATNAPPGTVTNAVPATTTNAAPAKLSSQ
jgi:hypothetical protein